MATNNSMTKITSKPFGVLNVDVYQNDKHQYYMTREQIGAALEYSDPRIAIYKIHQRNADRLDPLSSVTKLVTQVGNHTEERELFCYNLRGVMEICRFSRQPKADAFMDFCWDIMESLMRGDSVLATPKMDAVLSKEFIDVRLHALFDSMKNLQSELDSTRKELSEQIEEARATSNEALNVISSVSQCVHQIKDKQMDNAIRAKNYTPRNGFQDEMSDWRKDLYSKIGVIANTKGYTNKETLHKIYEYLNRNYGFVLEDARAKYIKRTNRSGKISTIDIIEEDSTWKSIMGAVVEDMYAASIERLHQNQNELRPVLKTIEAAPEVNVNDDPVVEVEVKEVVDEKPKKQSEMATRLVPIIEPLAQKLGDKTIHYHKTYRMVYNKIGFTKMENMMKQYKRIHGRVPSPKTKVFLENDKAMRMFKKAVKELMKEQESK
nr:MAG TPA: N BRO family, N-terminal domain [Caudoviricetes sp.]